MLPAGEEEWVVWQVMGKMMGHNAEPAEWLAVNYG